jgi:hypothetical protein
MAEISEKLLKLAAQHWQKKSLRETHIFDDKVREFLANPRKKADSDWLSMLLTGTGFSYQMMAEALKTSRQNIHQTVNREPTGEVTIHMMQKIAAACECEFVYAFVPKGESTMVEKIIKKTVPFLNYKPAKSIDVKRQSISLAMKIKKFLAKQTGWGIIWNYEKAKSREYNWESHVVY